MIEIKDLLTDENAGKVAEDIVKTLEIEVSAESLDLDYHINKGVMEKQRTLNHEIRDALIDLHGFEPYSPNTAFSFNAPPNSTLKYINDNICSLIESNQIEEKDYRLLTPFLKKVINLLNQESDLHNRIRAVLRRSALNGADEVIFPLKDVLVVLFEFGSKEDYGDIISVKKFAAYSNLTGGFVGAKNPVAQDLLKRRSAIGYGDKRSTREIYDTIVEGQRLAGNPLYASILPQDVKIVKEAKECHLDIFADYSPIARNEFEAKAHELLREKTEQN